MASGIRKMIRSGNHSCLYHLAAGVFKEKERKMDQKHRNCYFGPMGSEGFKTLFLVSFTKGSLGHAGLHCWDLTEQSYTLDTSVGLLGSCGWIPYTWLLPVLPLSIPSTISITAIRSIFRSGNHSLSHSRES